VGFTFGEFESHALLEALRRALAAYREPDRWRRVVANGMRQDWSWERQGALYVELYERLIQGAR